MIDETHAPGRRSWVASANRHADFPIQNLPFGVFSPPGRYAARRGRDRRRDFRSRRRAGAWPVRAAPRRRLRRPRPAPRSIRCSRSAARRAWPCAARIGELLDADGKDRARDRGRRARSCCTAPPIAALHVPAAIGDYTDFFAGINHATNAGKLFRPDNPLMPNYKYVPIGYHGRASSIGVSGTDVRRPSGQRKPANETVPDLRALPQPRLRTRARRLDRTRQRARSSDRDRRERRSHRRLLPAQRLVGARHPGLGIPAARAVSRQELLHHRLAVGGHAGSAGAVPLGAGAATAGDPAPLPYLLDSARSGQRRARHRA